MVGHPRGGESKACPQCGSLAVFWKRSPVWLDEPRDRTDSPELPTEYISAWKCGCGYFEPWHESREALKDHLRDIQACAQELAALPYSIRRARELSVGVEACCALAGGSAHQGGIVAPEMEPHLKARIADLLDAVSTLACADLQDGDVVRQAAVAVLERILRVERLVAAGADALPRQTPEMIGVRSHRTWQKRAS